MNLSSTKGGEGIYDIRIIFTFYLYSKCFAPVVVVQTEVNPMENKKTKKV